MGTFGQSFLVSKDGMQYVMKILKKSRLQEPALRLMELRFARNECKQLLSIHEVIDQNENIIVVYEYSEPGNLGNFIVNSCQT